ncbi:MAG: hypothetical protein IKW74_02560, partial [Thermoguttaceae bacterium]|nr:hypothetical protein [Thermoguttaceae bacterium]
APVTNYAPSLPSCRNFPEMKNDARLNDVFFLNPLRGWAVGDRGTIWTTFDGGNRWLLTETPTEMNLYSVHFLNDQFGMAVGGSVLPANHHGQGVVLRTLDGGQSWNIVETVSFPILRKIQILDNNLAWMGGDSSELYPGGLFLSDDGGENWESVSGNRHQGWQTVLYDRFNKTGVGIGLDGNVQTIRKTIRTTVTPPVGTRRIRALSHNNSRSNLLWIAGEGGLVMQSDDNGASWIRPSGVLPGNTSEYFDFSAVFAQDSCLWVAGQPGSLIFFSRDNGQSWESGFTGIRVPVRKIFFTDPQNGWAVGELGNIIATHDGGKSWTVQHEGGRRLALLGIFGSGDEIPYEILIQLAGEEGFLSEVLLLARETEREKAPTEIPVSCLWNEAVVSAGASGMEQCGLFLLDPQDWKMSRDKILERFDRENDGKGMERLNEYLVRQIRIWRPDVILFSDAEQSGTLNDTFEITVPTSFNMSTGSPSPLTDTAETGNMIAASALKKRSRKKLSDSPLNDPAIPLNASVNTQRIPDMNLLNVLAEHAETMSPPKKNPFLELIEQALPAAILAASDPLSYPEHLTECRLEPWNVRKVHQVVSENGSGNIQFDSSYFCTTLGRSVEELAREVRGIVDTSPKVRSTLSFRTLYDRPGNETASENITTRNRMIFDRITLEYGGEARRQRQQGLMAQHEALRERTGQLRQNLGIIDSITNGLGGQNPELLLSQIPKTIQGNDPEMALEYLLSLGQGFYESGNLNSAEEVYSIAALEFPFHPKCREAIVWLIQFYSSQESHWQSQRKNRYLDSTTELKAEEQLNSGDTQVLTSATSRLALDSSATSSRYTNADQLGKMVRDHLPELYMDPEIRFPLAQIQRKRGFTQDALKYYFNRSLASRYDLWGIRAQAEFWLQTPNRDALPASEQLCPLLMMTCRATRNKPYLDGILEPEIWNAAPAVPLSMEPLKNPALLLNEDRERTALQWQQENRELSTAWGTTFSMLCDTEYLYLGIQCPKVSGVEYPLKEDSPRTHDADLTSFDRIEIQFDLDRDYTTAYRIVFDCRGWSAESCWNDPGWNPPVFVAQNEDEHAWRLEVAIPFEALSERPPTRSDVWNISVRRLVPNAGMECWNAENSVHGENGFGFLSFGP